MRNSAAFRLVSHICLFLAVMALMPSITPESFLPYFLIVGAALICYLAGVQLNSAVLRLLVSLVPFAGLLLIPEPIPAIAAALPLIYAAIVLVSGRFFGEAWRYQKLFKPLALFAAAFTLIAALVRHSLSYSAADPSGIAGQLRGLDAFFLLIFGFFIFGFLSLCAQRLGSIRSAKWQFGIAGSFVLAMLAGAAIGVLLHLLAKPVSSFFALLIYPIGYFFSFLTRLFGGTLAGLKPFEDDFNATPAPATPMPDGAPEQAPAPAMPTEDPGFAPLIKNFNYPAFIIALVAIAALVLLIMLLLRARKDQGEIEFDNSVFEDGQQPSKRRFERRKRRRSVNTNADRVRDIYRSYLFFLNQNGIMTGISSTSGEISEKAGSLLDKHDELLRALYIKARYSENEITEEDAENAEQAYLDLLNGQHDE